MCDCGATFKSEKSLKRHIDNNVCVRSCPCGKSFSSKQRLDSHIKNRVCEKNKPTQCLICNKELSSHSSLVVHNKKPCGIKFECVVCEKEFSCYGKLQLHKDSEFCRKNTRELKTFMDNLRIKRDKAKFEEALNCWKAIGCHGPRPEMGVPYSVC